MIGKIKIDLYHFRENIYYISKIKTELLQEFDVVINKGKSIEYFHQYIIVQYTYIWVIVHEKKCVFYG
jgi:hypothetical protein